MRRDIEDVPLRAFTAALSEDGLLEGVIATLIERVELVDLLDRPGVDVRGEAEARIREVVLPDPTLTAGLTMLVALWQSTRRAATC